MGRDIPERSLIYEPVSHAELCREPYLKPLKTGGKAGGKAGDKTDDKAGGGKVDRLKHTPAVSYVT